MHHFTNTSHCFFLCILILSFWLFMDSSAVLLFPSAAGATQLRANFTIGYKRGNGSTALVKRMNGPQILKSINN